MDLITTHINADFDALSSLIAAGKLYPKARLLLPGAQEKAVRNFLALIKDEIKIEDEKTCRLDDVTRLVIVDNRHKSRIGDAAVLLDKKGMKIHIYDHHPRTGSDIKAAKDVFKKVGATVSIILEILDKKGKLNLTPLEATLMLLGIYEETGSLSYSMTTRLDVDMVSKLLERGARLNAVASYLNRELSPKEFAIFMDLMRSMEVVDINGTEVIFAQVDTTRFDGELGTVVHKLQEVENYPVIFTLFKTKDRIKILARSRLENVDVNKLLAHFNGAGHFSAASAKVNGKTVAFLRSEIIKLLKKNIKPEVYAGDIMSFPVRTVMEDEKVADVLEKLESSGHKGAPVLNDNAEIVGMITVGNLKKALLHKMAHSRVKGYMSTPLVTASPQTPLHTLRSILLKEGKGRIPVLKDNKLVGIVTRSDVLKKVHSALFPETRGHLVKVSNLSIKMKKELPKKLLQFISTIGKEADKKGVNAFLVGGFVRDLFLGKKNYDLDLVVEGSAIKFGKALARKIGGTLVEHHRFGTAALVLDWPKWLGPSQHPDNKFKIDIATARKEEYERPAALPTVEFSSLREDLYRRDFTINAMAVDINKKNFGLFIDFFGGKKDLEKGIIRTLHDKSFIDDPTRIFRAVRFEQRLGFQIEKHTEYLINHAVKKEMFRWTENQRIREELILILKENNPENAVLRMKELHELRFVHPALLLKRDIKKRFTGLRQLVKWYGSLKRKDPVLSLWLMNFILMLEKLNVSQTDDMLKNFIFTREESKKLREYKERSPKVLRKLSVKGRIKQGEVYDLLESFSIEALLCVAAAAGPGAVRRRIKKYITDYSRVKLKIKGDDIKTAGIEPGPKYNRILREVLHKKLEGGLPSKRDELRYMKEMIQIIK